MARLIQRLEVAEATAWARLPAAVRAEARIARGERFEALTNEELDAFLGDAADYLRALPTDLIEGVLALPEADGEATFQRLRAAYEQSAEAFASAVAEAGERHADLS